MSDWKLKTDHTDAEKIAAFDKMQAFAEEYAEARKNNERFKDAEHRAYELLLESTVGDVVWNYINSLSGDYDE